MENQPKLNNSKEVIAYLAKEFPQCFVAEGEARPLKIGIFQDIVERLGDTGCISKTQLRTALRLYTTSWRYLYGIKTGAERVDLDGQVCGTLNEQHVEYARKQLEEAKARVKSQKVELAANSKKTKTANPQGVANKPDANKPDANKPVNDKYSNNKPTKDNSKKPVQPNTKAIIENKSSLRSLSPEDIANLTLGQSVHVKLGQKAVEATIVEIVKDGARVQLASGMAMLVRAEHIQL